MPKIKLLPCPFCGSPAAVETFVYYDAPAFTISCSNGTEVQGGSSDDSCIAFELGNGTIYGSRRDAADAWNKRHKQVKP